MIYQQRFNIIEYARKKLEFFPNPFLVQIEAVTHISQASQKIIFKGKNLADPGVTLASYGIGPGAKVMVLGKKYDPEDDASYQAVAQVGKCLIVISVI